MPLQQSDRDALFRTAPRNPCEVIGMTTGLQADRSGGGRDALSVPTLIYFAALMLPVLVTAFGTTLSLLLVVATAIASIAVQRLTVAEALMPEGASAALLAFAGAALVSALWSPDAGLTVAKAALLALTTMGTLLAARAARRAAAGTVAVACMALIAVYLVLAAHTVFEVLTDQKLLKLYYNLLDGMQRFDEQKLVFADGKVAFVNEIFINRRVLVVTLLSLPAWIGAGDLSGSGQRMAVRAAIGAVLVVILFASKHETSKLAIVCGGIAILAATWSAKASLALLATLWLTATLLVVPVSLAIGGSRADEAAWVPYSAAERIRIWRHTAKRAIERPILGHGAASTPVHFEAESRARTQRAAAQRDALQPDSASKETIIVHQGDRLGPHAHNIYLQIWFEMGLLGAALLAAAGLAMLGAIWRIPRRQWQIAGLVQFSAVAASAATGYSLWQPWFQSLVALSVIFFVIAVSSIGLGRTSASQPEAAS